MFSKAIGPVLANLQTMKHQAEADTKSLNVEFSETDPQRILSTTRDCGISFATALKHVMEGILDLQPVMNLADELRAFRKHHENKGSSHFYMLPSDDFESID